MDLSFRERAKMAKEEEKNELRAKRLKVRLRELLESEQDESMSFVFDEMTMTKH